MEISIDQLKTTLSSLPNAQRAEIAEFLLETLEPDDTDEAWKKEIDRRMADIESGKEVGIPLEDFLSDMRAKYP